MIHITSSNLKNHKKDIYMIHRLLFAISLLLSVSVFGKSPATYLENRIPIMNGRYRTFEESLKLMMKRKVKTIVETGCERWLDSDYCFDGDGGSTILFAHWAYEHGAQMYSVDINETHLHYCKNNTKEYVKNLELVHQDSIEFLKNFSKPIDFLYLDSYDYDEKNPNLPQKHCLNEVKAAEDKLHDRSIIMIDDCNIPGGGKGLQAIRYLLSKGWHLHRNEHQVILLK